MTTKQKPLDENLTESVFNMMAEIWTLCDDINKTYPDWKTKMSKKNIKVIKRVLKMERSKKQ